MIIIIFKKKEPNKEFLDIDPTNLIANLGVTNYKSYMYNCFLCFGASDSRTRHAGLHLTIIVPSMQQGDGNYCVLCIIRPVRIHGRVLWYPTYQSCFIPGYQRASTVRTCREIGLDMWSVMYRETDLTILPALFVFLPGVWTENISCFDYWSFLSIWNIWLSDLIGHVLGVQSDSSSLARHPCLSLKRTVPLFISKMKPEGRNLTRPKATDFICEVRNLEYLSRLELVLSSDFSKFDCHQLWGNLGTSDYGPVRMAFLSSWWIISRCWSLLMPVIRTNEQCQKDGGLFNIHISP